MNGGSGSPQKQGADFERGFKALIGKLLKDDLGATVTENRIQPTGSQYGKDLQTAWREPGGREFFWHFECKSHRSGALPGKEIADKLLDAMKSSHQIDVWCLVLAHVEPGAWIDETLAWCREQLDLPFEIVVLSKEQNDLERLFACDRDLWLEQYGDGPDLWLDDDERAAAIDAFRLFLHDSTDRAIGRGVKAWQLVSPGRVDERDDANLAAAYLRGLCATAPWEVATKGWATHRESATAPLVERVLRPEPGFDFCWLVAAGGEGKSTVMRQVAWEVAMNDEWTVLWTAAELREDDAKIPVGLIEALGDAANVLLCIDDSERLTNAASLRATGAELAGADKRVFLLCADRGVVWNRSRLPGRLQRGLPTMDRKMTLPALTDAEIADIVAKLGSHSLLNRGGDEAAAILNRPPTQERTWLLPAMMQLTDPQGRGFEGILASVLGGLRAEPSTGPLALLLAASLVQASGQSLPEVLADRLLDGESGLRASMEVLTGELERQFGLRETADAAGHGGDTLLTHHRVIAEGFVQIAATDPLFYDRLLDVCESLPSSVAPDVTAEMLIPKPRFRILDAALRVLLEMEPPQFEAADRFLRSLIDIDNRQFPALTRLGECNADWLRAELAAGDPEGRSLLLAESARSAFREALEVAERVLADRESCPAPYRNQRLADVRALIRHAWGVLDSTAGKGFDDQVALRRSVMLFLETINSRGLGTLAIPLISLERWDLAVKAVAAFRAIAESPSEKSYVRRQEQIVSAEGKRIPDVGREVLDSLTAEIVTGLLWPDIDSVLLHPNRDAHRQGLVEGLNRAAAMIDDHEQIDLTLAILRKGE